MQKKSYQRDSRISDILQREIASLIQRNIKDPRLGKMVTVSAVQVSRDLSSAKVYITQLDTQKESIKMTLDILNQAAGYMQSQLGQRVKLRITPRLRFIYDQSISHGAYLHRLMKDLKCDDE